MIAQASARILGYPAVNQQPFVQTDIWLSSGSPELSLDERQAWIDLWEAVFGEPPPIQADSDLTARILVEHLPAAPPYELKSRTE